MKQKIIYTMLSLFYVFGLYDAKSQTQDFMGTVNFHETIRDVANMSNNRQVFVGSKTSNLNGTRSNAFIMVKNNSNNTILWSRTLSNPTDTTTDEVFTRVRIAANGDILAMGYYDYLSPYVKTRGFMARYSQTGTLIWCNSYLTNITGIPAASNNGTIFFDFDLNPATDSIFVCGSTDFLPGDARSYVTCLNAATGAMNWQTDINTLTGANGSDNFMSIVYQNGLLYTTGFANVGATFDDATFYCMNAVNGTIQWGRNISFLSLHNAGAGNVGDNVPLQIYVNGNTFLLAGVTQNNFGASLSQTSFTLRGQFTTTGALTNLQGFSYRSPVLANTYENHTRILPTDLTLSNFYLTSSPGTALSGSPVDVSVANPRDSKISLINGMNNLIWSRQFVDSGQQGIFSMLQNGAGLTLAGNSLNSPYSIGASTIRDGYVIQTQLPIPLVSSGSCQIRNDSVIINPLTSIVVSNYGVTTAVLPAATINSHTDIVESLLQKSACATCIDSNTTVFSSDSTFTSDVIFNGKYYIAANVILTVSANASLDITNCDMIFGPCAGINFGTNSVLRANNSVFRPCFMNDTWRGLFFSNSAKSIIDECTFKNATYAVNAVSTDLKFNNNYVQNCWRGLEIIAETDYSSPTTGNNFVMDEDYNSLNFCNTVTTSNQNPISIYIDHSIVSGDISHNTFTANNQQDIIAQSIVCNASHFKNISLNRFANVGNGIVIQNTLDDGTNDYQLVSGNEFVNENIQQGNSYSAFDLQAATSVQIVDNHLTNLTSSLFNGNGINMIKSARIKIDNNEIKGFANSIGLEGSSVIFINNNILQEAFRNGIVAYTSNNVMIKCNEIDLNHHDGVGIVIDGYDNYEVFTNCIFNTLTAIKIDYIFSSTTTDNVKIYNNYLYNYKFAGIENSGCPNLYIGTPVNFGQNTFWSNRPSSTFDVLTNAFGMTFMYNNYNVNNISVGTNILQNYQMFSTASCANQIEGNPGPMDGNYKEIFNCENNEFINMEEPHEHGKYNKFTVFDQQSRYSYEEYFQFMYRIQTKNGFITTFMNKIMNDPFLTSEQKIWLSLYAYISSDKLSEANTIYQQLNQASIQDKRQMILFAYQYGKLFGLDYKTLDQSYTSELLKHYDEQNMYKNIIYQLVHGQVENADLYFTDYSGARHESTSSIIKISSGENNMTIYPNPVKDELNMIFSTTSNHQNTLLIYNAMGEQVYTQPIMASSGKVTVNLTQLATGNYFAVLKNSDNVQHFKFAKE